MIVSLQNKKETHSIKNCKMLGFPTVSLSKNLDVLLKNGWTISIWHQHDIKGKDKKERKHFKTFTTTINLNDNENLRLNNWWLDVEGSNNDGALRFVYNNEGRYRMIGRDGQLQL